MTVALPTYRAPSRRAQIAGSIAILAVVGFWTLLVPYLGSQATSSNAFTAGQSYDLGGATVVAPAGWAIGDNSIEGTLTELEKAGAQLTVTGAAPATGSAEQQLTAMVDAQRAIGGGIQVGKPELFTTGAGTPAGRLISQTDPTHISVTYIVSDGASTVTGISQLDNEQWMALQDEMDAVMKTVVLTGAPS